MTTESLISESNTPTNTVDQLVGEGKKFKTIDDLATGKLEADRHIQTLESELALARAEINSRARMEEILEQIEAAKASADALSQKPNQGGAEGSNTPDLNKLIEETITKREAARTASQNVSVAEAELKKHFGDDYQTKVKAKAEALRMSVADVNELAKKSPTALLELMGVTAKPGTPAFTPPPSSLSSDKMPFTPNTGGARNWDYYENLRKTDKTRYNSPEVQMQLHNDAIAAANRGEDFGIKY